METGIDSDYATDPEIIAARAIKVSAAREMEAATVIAVETEMEMDSGAAGTTTSRPVHRINSEEITNMEIVAAMVMETMVITAGVLAVRVRVIKALAVRAMEPGIDNDYVTVPEITAARVIKALAVETARGEMEVTVEPEMDSAVVGGGNW